VKRCLSLRHWILALAIVLMLGLVACERPLQEEIEEAADGEDSSMLEAGALPYDPSRRSLPLLETDSTVLDAYPGPETDSVLTVAEPGEDVPAVPEPVEPLIYEVQSGDTLVNIAIQYNVTVEDIATASGLANVDVLDIGQRLVIPVDGVVIQAEAPAEVAVEAPADAVEGASAEETVVEEAAVEETNDQIHVVQIGDNLFRIGLLYGCKHEELALYNNLANPDSLEIGQEIRIPTCE
jgi:LysM repeat protein